jgi:hypothetical protein
MDDVAVFKMDLGHVGDGAVMEEDGVEGGINTT